MPSALDRNASCLPESPPSCFTTVAIRVPFNRVLLSLLPVRYAAKLTLPWIGRLRAISALDLTWRGMVAAEFKDRAFACGPPDATTLLGTDALGLFPQFVPTGRRFVLVRWVGMQLRRHSSISTSKWHVQRLGANIEAGSEASLSGGWARYPP